MKNENKNSSSLLAKVCKGVGGVILFLVIAGAIAQFVAWLKGESDREEDENLEGKN